MRSRAAGEPRYRLSSRPTFRRSRLLETLRPALSRKTGRPSRALKKRN